MNGFDSLTWDGCVRLLRRYDERLERGIDVVRTRRWHRALVNEMRRRHGLAPVGLEAAFADWRSNDLYLGNDGHYRLKSNRGRIAKYDRALRAAFPDNGAFHDAVAA